MYINKINKEILFLLKQFTSPYTVQCIYNQCCKKILDKQISLFWQCYLPGYEYRTY